mmetsp:Transcript_38808/g.101126  ORF Transcript_38808/g.101126 Transcript_38808/m.101126 type:complete len:453 (-) Transcript_38808:152-1510(-)
MRSRRLLLAVALLAWVAPANPEVLEKRKKKHHHHHRRHHHSTHNLTEAANKTANHTSVALHARPHHEVLQVHPNASTQPRHVAKAAPVAARPGTLPAKAPAQAASAARSPVAARAAGKPPAAAKAKAARAAAPDHGATAAAKARLSVVASGAPPVVAAAVHAQGDPPHRASKGQKARAAQSQEAVRLQRGQISVGGPLPPDFEERFVQGVVQATGVSAKLVEVLSVRRSEQADGNIDELAFAAPAKVVEAVEEQASDPESKLARGILHIFLIDRSSAEDGDQGPPPEEEREQRVEEEPPAEHEDVPPSTFVASRRREEPQEGPEEGEDIGARPAARDDGIDIDAEMPYGDLEPFGREDTAQELTDSSIRESDQMVDQLERAEVAEEKRAVFRALTRLRGAAITSFDGIARSQTGNIDEYNTRNRWRSDHPLHHLADEESDVNKWAFPAGEDC